MFFALVLSAVAPLYLASAMVATGPRKPPPLSTVPAEYICSDTGLIKSWKGADSMDTKILKDLIENGNLDGYNTKSVQSEYSRFKRFTSKCLGDKLSNLRRSFRENAERRDESKSIVQIFCRQVYLNTYMSLFFSVDLRNGGGHGLAAKASSDNQAAGDDDYFQRRFGSDIYDEDKDPDYEYVEEMSRLSLDDGDEFSFGASTVRRPRSVTAPNSQSNPLARMHRISFAPGTQGGESSGAPSGILRSGRNNNSIRRTRGRIDHGGSFGEYFLDRWCDKDARKRLSIQLHFKSCVSARHAITGRVSSDQKEFVFSSPFSQCLLNKDEMLSYIYDRVQERHPYIDTWEKFVEFMSSHPRVIARAKTVARIRKQNPNLTAVVPDLRIPLGTKVSFDFVKKEEDPYFYGMHMEDGDDETHIFVELKEERDSSAGQTFTTAHRPQRMSPIPESVSFRSGEDDSLGSASVMEYSYRSSGASVGSTSSKSRSSKSVTSRSVRSRKSAKSGGTNALINAVDDLEGEFQDAVAAYPLNKDNASVTSGNESPRKTPRKSTASDVHSVANQSSARSTRSTRSKRKTASGAKTTGLDKE